MDEWWDLVDAAGVTMGRTLRRGDVGWPGGAFHLVVTVCVYRADGTVLLTQRAPTKEFAFGWEFPGGSAFAGETGPAAACRELLEETNVRVEPEALRRVGRFTEETALVDLFVVQEPSGSAVRADPAEVMDWRWVSLSEVIALRQGGVMAEPWGPRLDALWPAATASILAADDSLEDTSR
ncbi:NUDIX domain-containing protein [Curtobacterium flaccumfaciens pv. flaccumfaciens]|uniref:NUDIX domain-containing protein n=1 Tax=Curtobacterium flaccumfaciens TaxID=2035 RepID=UPI003A4DF725